MRPPASLDGEAGEEVRWWSQALERGCREHLADLLFQAPWLALAPAEAARPREEGLTSRSEIRNPKSEIRPAPSPPAAALEARLARLNEAPTLREVSELDQSLCPLIEEALRDRPGEPVIVPPPERERLTAWLSCLHEASDRARQRLLALEGLARQTSELAAMDFTFLFDPVRDLFSIGYSVTERRLDASFYDLLASEARLCSFVVIAQGQVSQDHWFSLGRLLVASQGEPVLVSWGGSLFEYLMPLLVMPTHDHTLLDQAYQGAVAQQIAHGRLHGVPWGVSESQYNRTDVQLNYQYRAFGVPGLGLKRGLADDLVIAPHASVMALMVAPREACQNLERLTAEGRAGAYGFYEAVDYTPARLPPGQSSVTIRSFMAHHQGMSLLALAYVVLDCPMQRRFLACPLFRATDLLLQERVPHTAAKVLAEDLEPGESRRLASEAESGMRVFTSPGLHAPEVHLLSNGRYHVVVSNAGGGYSRWLDLAVTRWREDPTRDCWGTFVYLREGATGEFWSAAHQPTLAGGRRGAAARDADQPLAPGTEHRADELRGGGARAPGDGRGPSRLQQPLRANGIRRPAPRPALHPPPPLRRRAAAVAPAPDGDPGWRTERHFVGNRSRPLCRPRPEPGPAGCPAEPGTAVQHRRLRPRSHHLVAAHGNARAA
jgi:cyclic beta-1,2-glucan synthetase